MRALSDATAAHFVQVGILPTDRLHVSVDKTLTKLIVHISGSPYASASASRRWIALVPERKQIKDLADGWELGASDFTVAMIRHHWPDNQVIYEDDDTRRFVEYIERVSNEQDQVAEAIAHFKATGELPPGASAIPQNPDLPLTPYQLVGAWASLRSPGFGEFMEMGTGKTPTAVGVISAIARAIHSAENRMARVLVVAPKNVRQNWVGETVNFAGVGGKIEVIRGGEMQRIQSIVEALCEEDGCEFTVVVLSYEVMVRSLPVLTAIQWDLCVLDESHHIMTPAAKRTKAAHKLRDVCVRRLLLTGTPVCNTPLDLWAQFEFMGKGYSGFTSFKAFKDFYGVFDVDGATGHQRLVGCQNLPFMKERLARLTYSVSKAEALPDLPDKVHDIVEVEMTAQQAEVYEQLAEQLALEIEQDMAGSENKAMTIQNGLTKLLRLTQVTSGYLVFDKVVSPETGETITPQRVEYFNENPKLEALMELLRDKAPNEKTIVWASFVPDIMKICERLTAEGIKHVRYHGTVSEADRQNAIDAFNNDPTVKVFVGNQGAGGAGVNLLGYPPHAANKDEYETNCSHVIYYVQDWSHPKRSQSEDRCHRRGTRTNVRITDLCVPDTIDEEIRARVLKKRHAAMEVKDVREILAGILAKAGRRDA